MAVGFPLCISICTQEAKAPVMSTIFIFGASYGSLLATKPAISKGKDRRGNSQ